MSFRVIAVEPQEWEKMSAEAHLLAFKERRPRDMDRVDFALLALDECDKPSGYISCIEMDKETLYWQHGGAMPHIKDTVLSYKGYCDFVKWGQQHFKRITTRIENTNLVMLKMALKVGFLIRGTYTHNGKIFVELCLEF